MSDQSSVLAILHRPASILLPLWFTVYRESLFFALRREFCLEIFVEVRKVKNVSSRESFDPFVSVAANFCSIRHEGSLDAQIRSCKSNRFSRGCSYRGD